MSVASAAKSARYWVMRARHCERLRDYGNAAGLWFAAAESLPTQSTGRAWLLLRHERCAGRAQMRRSSA